MAEIYKKVSPKSLKNHLMNIEIYGDAPNQDVLESIRKKGIITPLTVTAENVIISGHTRNQCAKMLDLKEVPVIVRTDLKDELDIREAIIEANKQRDKTTEVKAREFQYLKAIEEERAKKRQATSTGGTAPQLKENFPEAEKPRGKQGQSRDIAAKKIGMSGKSAEDAAAVVQRIDELKQEGETERAEQLTKALNKSVSGAKKLLEEEKQQEESKKPSVLDGMKKPVPEPLEVVFSDLEFFGDSVRTLQAVLRDTKEHASLESGAFLRVQDIEAGIKNAINAIRFAKPFTECPTCKRKVKKNCKNCKGSGYITKRHYGESSGSGTISKDERSWLENR